MVFGNTAFDDFDVHRFADLPDKVPQADRYFTVKNWLAVFRDPHHMKFDVINSVRSLTVLVHNTASLLKSSPKGEGFSPIPRRGQ